MSARGLMAAVDWLGFGGEDGGGSDTNKGGNGSSRGGLLGSAMASTL